MFRVFASVVILLPSVLLLGQCTEPEVRAKVMSFEHALAERNLPKIGALVSPEIVVFENGHRNNGWDDFRDHHLKPEFEEAAPQITSEIIKIEAYDSMAWAYSRGSFATKTASGGERPYELWSVYVLSKHDSECRIAMLDWSMRMMGGGGAEPPDDKPSPAVTPGKWSVAALQKRLQGAGLIVHIGTKIQQPFMSVLGKVLTIGTSGEAEIQVYIYRDSQSRKRDTDKLDPARVAPPSMSVIWLMPPSLAVDDNLAVIILTANDDIRTRVRNAVLNPATRSNK